MKILQKQKILNMISSLDEAHKQLSFQNNEFNVELLTVCQETAISIGHAIENSDSYEVETIKLLEEYCELVYQLSIINVEKVWEQYYQDICTSLSNIVVKIQNDIKSEQIKVLFIPYNASMWDSMDSIYQEAIKDKRCHVSVMPISYYNLNPEGEITAVKYEGNQFPDYIKQTDYKGYNLVEEHPDIIFIHNPYDQYNRVTRVPTSYYSSELCKITKYLVYVPYFVSDATVSEHMCFMPGVKNSWRTFVQSESIRQQYTKWNSEEKIVALGSPKFDMVIKLDTNKPTMPYEWKKAFTNRKIFLYNSHLNNIMNNSQLFIEKLRTIFKLFEGRNDMAILWRPHPLSIETAKSMQPQVLVDYLKMIDDFRRMDNAIYDDSSDSQRAIALSDAYIGDRSSILTLYMVTGKPIYIMNDLNSRHLTCIDGNIENGAIWMFSKDFNALFKLDLLTKKVEYVDTIITEPKLGMALYKEIIPYKNKLFLIPSGANNIVEYDLNNHTQRYYDCNRRKNSHGVKNANVIIENNLVYIYPMFYGDNIVILNMDKSETEQIKLDYEILEDRIPDKNKTIWGSGVKVGDTHWCPLAQTNSFVSIGSDGVHIYDVDSKNKGFISLTYDGENFWATPNIGGNIVKWNAESEIGIEYTELPSGCIIREAVPFARIVYCNDHIWLIPSNASMIVKINKDTGKMSGIDIGKERYLSYEIYKDELYLFPYLFSDHIIKINTLNSAIDYIKVDYPLKHNNQDFVDYYAYHVEDVNRENYLYASNFCGLEEFAEKVIQNNDKDSKNILENWNINNLDGTCGKKIWNYILDNID